jgi:hypothetical protein
MPPEVLKNVVDAALVVVLTLHAAKFVVVEIADLWIQIRRLQTTVAGTARFTTSM